MDEKNDFIYSAIEDTQSTIRAIDAKVFATLASTLVPISSLGKILSHFSNINTAYGEFVGLFLGSLFFALWIASTASLIKAMASIDNPANHIANSFKYKGTFYCGGLYKFNFKDIFYNRNSLLCEKEVHFISTLHPSSSEEISIELTYEHLKLVYIRDIKLHRFNHAVFFATMWVMTGIIVYFISTYLK